MNKNIVKSTAIFAAIALTVVTALIFGSRMSAEDAIRLQSMQLLDATKALYVAYPVVTDGDKTKLMVVAGVVNMNNAMVSTYPTDDFELRRMAMKRLMANEKTFTIKNEFGGDVRVIAKDNKLSVVYTKVPANINCGSISNVVCERL